MQEKQIRKNCLLLRLIVFFSEFKLYAAVAVLFFSEATGSMTLGMGVFSVVMVSATLLEVPTGVLSDAVGRKKTLIVGALVSLGAGVAYAANNGLIYIYGGAVLEGLALALFSGNNDALLYDLLKESGAVSTYQHHLGKIASMGQVALAVANVFGGIILEASSYSIIMWISVVPRVFCLLLTFWIDEPAKETGREQAQIWQHLGEMIAEVRRSRRLGKLIIADSLSGGAGEAAYQFRAMFLRLVWPVWAIGLAGTLSSLGAAASFWFSGGLIERAGVKRIIIGSKVYSLLCNVASFMLQNTVSPILLTSTSLLFGVSNVAQNDLSQRLYTDRHRASLASLKSLVTSCTYAIFAVILGLIADHLGVVTALISFQLFQVVALILYMSILNDANDHLTPSSNVVVQR